MKSTSILLKNKVGLLSQAFFLILILVSAVKLEGQTTWTGAVSTDWNIHGNWNPGIPDGNDEVIIPLATNNPVIMSGTMAEAKSVKVEADGHLTISNGASLTIDNSTQIGLENLGMLDNYGTLWIGQIVGIGTQGLDNRSHFTNHTTGQVFVDNTGRNGIENFSNHFTNNGIIKIGQNGPIGQRGIENDRGFVNNPGGEIHIDDTGSQGIDHIASIEDLGFINFGKIIIGLHKKINSVGLFSDGKFENHSSGEIQIEETERDGLQHVVSTFTNHGKISIGAIKPSGQNALSIAGLNPTFNNASCGEIHLFGKLSTESFGGFPDGTINNFGFFYLDTEEVHTPTQFNNHGVVADLQGTFFGATNEEIIIAPITVNCSDPISPAFNLGATVDFIIHGIFTDQAASSPAGSYDVITNLFTPSIAPDMYTLYVQIEDDMAGCTKVVPWKLTIEDFTPPIAACHDITVTVDGGQTAILESDQLWDEVSSSDNCGAVFFEQLSITAITCVDFGTIVPVQVTINDGNGNTGQCTGNVTVTGLPCSWEMNSIGLGCESESSLDPGSGVYSLSSEACYDPSYYRMNDQHGFIQQELCGDGEIIAQVSQVVGTGWAGISMRESNDPSARMIQLMLDGQMLTRREARLNANSQAFAHVFQTLGKNWLRLTRVGTQFNAYHSLDGINWQTVFSTNINMSNCIPIGLITMNNTASDEMTAIFENVSVNGSAPITLGIPRPDIDIAAQENTVDFYMYPNPSAKVVHLYLEHFIGKDVQTSIFNQFGQIVFQQQWQRVSDLTEQIDLSNIQAGTYFVEISSGTERVRKKLVVTGL